MSNGFIQFGEFGTPDTICYHCGIQEKTPGKEHKFFPAKFASVHT